MIKSITLLCKYSFIILIIIYKSFKMFIIIKIFIFITSYITRLVGT